MGNTIIRKASYKDLKSVAKIHKELFPDHYLGQFSIKLIEKFYGSFLNKDVVFFVSVSNGEISGFVLGGNRNDINQCLSFFMKDNIPLYAFEIIFRPQTWSKSTKKLVGVFLPNKNSKESQNHLKKHTLLSIGVSSLYQGKGIAKKLVAGFNLKIKELTDVYSLSVKETNLHALRFYENNGFIFKGVYNGDARLTKKI